MVSSVAVQSPADAVNAALVRLGYRLRVGSLFDGSDAAKNALDVYAQTRDELLRQNDWGFAERNIAATLLKSAPAAYVPPTVWNPALNPPLPWRFEYVYPGDCLKVRAVKPTPIFLPDYDPQPFVFSVINDNLLNPPAKAIVCNAANAILVYTGQVTDPITWEADFTEAFIDALAEVMAPSTNPEMLKLLVPASAQTQAIAEREQG